MERSERRLKTNTGSLLEENRVIDMNFIGENIIVTGGASGIGQSVAEGIVAGGGYVVIVDINEETADKTVHKLGENNACFYSMDLADSDGIRTTFKNIIDQKRHIHGLVNCAGIVSTKPFEQITQNEWDHVIAINLTGVYTCTSAIFEHMKEMGGGRIINVASVAAKIGGGLLGTSAYAASKAGVIGLTKAVAKEGAKYGIACNAVCPSLTMTGMTNNIEPQKFKQILEMIPMHRAAQPQEIANVILFFLSNLASFVTGEISDVDGGITMD
jgi:3-oxoacyl-[acyl-carrier protein] reductase